jgi:2-desacetyl-2-hydroxyethyl bacteriochlorophyllide A dehydrogenase
VRLGEVKADEYVVVLGGGPIGALVALVTQQKGARVLVSEINPFRIKLLREFGVEVVNPTETDLIALVEAQTGGAGADVVFEVTSSKAGAEMMTKLPRVRGRIVVVAIFSQPPQVDLFKFFWREISLRGARVYEAQDFEEAIALAASGALPLDKLITNVCPLDDLEWGLRQLEQGGEVMKVLIECA